MLCCDINNITVGLLFADKIILTEHLFSSSLAFRANGFITVSDEAAF